MAVSNKVRFEVLKRDNFTCQYCGRRAPEVVLQMEHVIPVAKGGTDDIMNLVAGCFECNSGKSDRLLSDNSVLEKRRAQTEVLQERLEQIELIAKWQTELAVQKDVEVQAIADFIHEQTGGWQAFAPLRAWNDPHFDRDEHGSSLRTRRELKSLIKKHGFLEMFAAVREFCEDEHTEDEWNVCLDGFAVIVKQKGYEKYRRENPVPSRMSYCFGILRRKRGRINFAWWNSLREQVTTVETADALIAMAKRVDSCSEFVEALQEGNHAN